MSGIKSSAKLLGGSLLATAAAMMFASSPALAASPMATKCDCSGSADQSTASVSQPSGPVPGTDKATSANPLSYTMNRNNSTTDSSSASGASTNTNASS